MIWLMAWLTVVAPGLDAPEFEYDLEDLYIHKMGYCAVSDDAVALTFMGLKQGFPTFEIAVFDFGSNKAALVDDGRVRPMGVPFAVAEGNGFALFDIRPNAPPLIYRISRRAVFEDIWRPEEFEGWEPQWSVEHVAAWERGQALVSYRDRDLDAEKTFLAVVDLSARRAVTTAARSVKPGYRGFWASHIAADPRQQSEAFWVEEKTGYFQLLDPNRYFNPIRDLTRRMDPIEKSEALKTVFSSFGVPTSPFQACVHVPGASAAGLAIQWRQYRDPKGAPLSRSRRTPFLILSGEGRLRQALHGLPLAQRRGVQLCLDIENGQLSLEPAEQLTAWRPATTLSRVRGKTVPGPQSFFSAAAKPYDDRPRPPGRE